MTKDLITALHNHLIKASSTPLCLARSPGQDQVDLNATASLVATPLILTSVTMVPPAARIILPQGISVMMETCRKLKESQVHLTASLCARIMMNASSFLSGQRSMGSIKGGVTFTPVVTS